MQSIQDLASEAQKQLFSRKWYYNDFSDFPNPIMADRLFHRSPNEIQPVSEWLKGATTAQDYANKARELSKALIS